MVEASLYGPPWTQASNYAVTAVDHMPVRNDAGISCSPLRETAFLRRRQLGRFNMLPDAAYWSRLARRSG